MIQLLLALELLGLFLTGVVLVAILLNIAKSFTRLVNIQQELAIRLTQSLIQRRKT